MIETLASQAEARPVRFGAATNNILPCFIALDRANKRMNLSLILSYILKRY